MPITPNFPYIHDAIEEAKRIGATHYSIFSVWDNDYVIGGRKRTCECFSVTFFSSDTVINGCLEEIARWSAIQESLTPFKRKFAFDNIGSECYTELRKIG